MKKVFLCVFLMGAGFPGTALCLYPVNNKDCAVGTTTDNVSLGHALPEHEPNGEYPEDIDTLKYKQLQEVVVKGVKAQKDAPFAVTNVGSSQLNSFGKSGRELPVLFSNTPGVLSWGENGLGTGTVYMRIRGAGDSRINVTLDGVPLNSPEDQRVFWANMNSYSSLLGNAQIQRGVGTSTNGDGAFGGAISLTSKAPETSPYGEISASYGSYNTYNVGGSFSTGLIKEHFIFDGAYHETNTDGYIHGTGGRSGSYYGGLSWLGKNFILRYKNFGNFEKTGQAWNGVIAGDYDGNVLWDENGVPEIAGATYGKLHELGYGKFNSLVENVEYDWNGGLSAKPYMMKNGKAWDKTTDNFWQNRNILSLAWAINDAWKTSVSLHYTHGYGYYTEFKYNNKLSKFGLPNLTLSDGTTLKKTDFVRKKGLKQDSYGAVWNVNYENESWDIVGGANLQRFTGNHFGYLTYMKDDELEAKYLKNGDYKYYDSDATKSDISTYLKATLHISTLWDVFADVQYRHVGYKTDGYNDKYWTDADGKIQKHILDIDEKYDFFNPKAGVSFHKDNHNAYASVAVSHREPERNNFTDNGKYPAPKAEQLIDFELGYGFTGERWHADVNLYYMKYKDQFVQTGETSDIGEALTTNIKDSYRLGAEISAGVQLLKWLSLDGNIALSENRIKDFDEYVSGYDADWNEKTFVIHYDKSTLAYSPSVIGNVFLTARHKNLTATWHTQGVSRQYLDNSESNARSLPGYGVSNVSLGYKISTLSRNSTKSIKSTKSKSPSLEFTASLNNIFDRHFAQSGFVWYQYIATSGERLSHNSYIPSAGFTAMGSITLRF